MVEDRELQQKRVEFKFPLLMLRTQRFSSLFDKLGSRRLTRVASWVALYAMPVIAALGVFFILTSLAVLVSTPAAREAQREISPQAFLLVPVLNPYLPFVYGWIGIIVGIIAHEGGHGVVARSLGLRVKSSGLLFFLFIPIGAFVEVDEEQLAKERARASVRVLAAGPGANVALAAVSIIGIIIIVSGLSPAISGVFVVELVQGMPAGEAGIQAGDLILQVDNVRVEDTDLLVQTLNSKSMERKVSVRLLNLQSWEERTVGVTLAQTAEGPRLGIRGVPLKRALQESLDRYRELSISAPVIHLVPPTLPLGQALHPYSEAYARYYQHQTLGSLYLPLTSIIYWSWFVNINLAIFNTLPIYPLDGGQALRFALLRGFPSRISEKTASIITKATTVILIAAIILLVAVPYLPLASP